MTLVVPHTWIAGDDALSSYLQTLSDASLQLQGNTPVATGTRLDYFSGYTNNLQAVASGATGAAIGIDVEEDDYANGHSLVSNTSRYIGQTAGRYLVTAVGLIQSNASGHRQLSILKTGAGLPGQGLTLSVNPDTSANTFLHVAGAVRLNGTTDYVEAWVFQTSGVSLNCGVRLNVIYLGA